MDSVEKRVIERLTDHLGTASAADEMFRVFARFAGSSLPAARARHRAAVQAHLIGSVALHTRNRRPASRAACATCRPCLRARQMELQLDCCWRAWRRCWAPHGEQHAEGHRLKETGEAIKPKEGVDGETVPAMEASWHEIVQRKHALYLDPPLQEARMGWVHSLHSQSRAWRWSRTCPASAARAPSEIGVGGARCTRTCGHC